MPQARKPLPWRRSRVRRRSCRRRQALSRRSCRRTKSIRSSRCWCTGITITTGTIVTGTTTVGIIIAGTIITTCEAARGGSVVAGKMKKGRGIVPPFCFPDHLFRISLETAIRSDGNVRSARKNRPGRRGQARPPPGARPQRRRARPRPRGSRGNRHKAHGASRGRSRPRRLRCRYQRTRQQRVQLRKDISYRFPS